MLRKWNSLFQQGSRVSKVLFSTLALLGIVGVAAALVAAQSVSDKTHRGGGERLEGVFLVNVTPDAGGPPPSMLIRMFTPNGGVVGPQASVFGSIVCGEWVRTGDRQFAITLASFNYMPAGPVSGTVKTVGSVTLNNEGNELTGRFRVQSFDLTGNLLTSFTASVAGKRIQVEQFP
ncbi:MAG TPA: hypothetical protein VKK06_12060 [Terriglobia bacterium]|nr:hypothetical protein [Terriglobia bacterium]